MAKVDLEKMRHSCSHLMAAAVMELYPKTRFGIGPSIEDGFYYDFDIPGGLSEEDLLKIEEKMRELAEKNLKFEKAETKIDEALKIVKKLGQTYKVELIQDLKKEGVKKVIFYKLGDFVDLCEGPHIRTTKEIGPFKLLSVAGAYWRGSEENPMLTRIYGTCFASKSALEKYLIHREETQKRNHRKLGQELELFMFEGISPGAPFWLPKGMVVYKELEKLWRHEHEKRGYLEISTPILVKNDVFKISGHWEFYQHLMFNMSIYEEEEIKSGKVKMINVGGFKIPEVNFSLKPMNCPETMHIYKRKIRSYKDLPLRFSEIGRLHRREPAGTLTGLLRVRQITMDDAHIFTTVGQMESEIRAVIKLIRYFYKIFSLTPKFSFSTRPEKHMGKKSFWDKAEARLVWALKKENIRYKEKPGEGAFYGPKIDAEVEDILGRVWQLATIQLDFQMPERFELVYIDRHGRKRTPIMIHRAIFGSFERFIGFLIEHYGGAFPVWLSPVQAVVIPITDKHNKYAKQIYDTLINSSIRAELDDRSQTTSAKIRDGEIQRTPYMLVVGDKEVKAKKVNVRTRGERVLGSMSLEKFLSRIKQDIVKKRQV